MPLITVNEHYLFKVLGDSFLLINRVLSEIKRMKCSTNETTTVQVFGKTAKNGLKSINVLSKSHWHSPVFYSLRIYVLLNEISKQKSKIWIPATHNAGLVSVSCGWPWFSALPFITLGKTRPCSQLQADRPDTLAIIWILFKVTFSL